MTQEIKYLDIAKFREDGYLQEANRLFFHPLGLALEVSIDDDGTETLGRIWDYRDDPEGMLFGTGLLSQEKVDKIALEWAAKAHVRREQYGFIVQPADAVVSEIQPVEQTFCGPTDDEAVCACGCSGYDERCPLYLKHLHGTTQVPESHNCCVIPGR